MSVCSHPPVIRLIRGPRVVCLSVSFLRSGRAPCSVRSLIALITWLPPFGKLLPYRTLSVTMVATNKRDTQNAENCKLCLPMLCSQFAVVMLFVLLMAMLMVLSLRLCHSQIATEPKRARERHCLTHCPVRLITGFREK